MIAKSRVRDVLQTCKQDMLTEGICCFSEMAVRFYQSRNTYRNKIAGVIHLLLSGNTVYIA